MSFSTKQDFRSLRSLCSRVKAFDKTEIQIGFFDDSYGPDNDNLSVASVAWMNENGTYHNPRRPFLGPTFDDWMNQAYFAKRSGEIFTSLLDNGRQVNQKLKLLGSTFVDIVVTNIDDYPGSNSKWWAKYKGFNDPLRYTGKMMASVKFKIVK